ncbi:hypothetical protein [Pseudorhodoplanes sp.]|uniref:hypothetical protein n=1 Tax=Pseudorhodoplanes sp. TaxID=1934341 RepID=UPI00391A6A18
MREMFRLLKAVSFAAVWIFVFMQSASSNPPDRIGSVRIIIADHTFIVPRILLSSVISPSGKDEGLWRKQNELSALSFQISAYKSNLGTSQYEQWTRHKGLPNQIRIGKALDSFQSTFNRLMEAKKTYPQKRTRDGFEVTETGSAILYNAINFGLRSSDNEPIVFACSKNANLRAGHTCRTAYRYGRELTIFYSFDDSNASIQEWVHLDGRVREYVEMLSAKRS